MLYVVADDEVHLGAFPITGDHPGHLIRMIDSELPASSAERKKVKPDFEALTRLAPFDRYAYGALLALGSGSREQRRRAALLALDQRGVNATSVRLIDGAGMFEELDREIDDLNIEGAAVSGDRLILMHRGNKRHPANALIGVSLRAVLTAIVGGDSFPKFPILSLRHYDLGAVEGIPLCFSDGVALPDGKLVFSAVAEDTSDNYNDGPCIAAAIGMIGTDGEIVALDYLDTACKVEGVHAERDGPVIKLWLVTDADDATIPAVLLTGELVPPSGISGH